MVIRSPESKITTTALIICERGCRESVLIKEVIHEQTKVYCNVCIGGVALLVRYDGRFCNRQPSEYSLRRGGDGWKEGRK
jgi:hypothetical protein